MRGSSISGCKLQGSVGFWGPKELGFRALGCKLQVFVCRVQALCMVPNGACMVCLQRGSNQMHDVLEYKLGGCDRFWCEGCALRDLAS